MAHLILQLTFFLLKAGVALAPRDTYIQKVNAVISAERKNDGFDLKGWEYRSIASARPGVLHRYYEFPGPASDAPVCLMLHGMNLDGRNFVHLRSLSRRYRLIAYDFPDRSPVYDGSLDGFTALVRDFLNVMHIDRFHLVGVSFGGVISIRLTASLPGTTVTSLVLASSGVVGTTQGERQRSRDLGAWVSSLQDYQVYWVMEKMTGRFINNFPASMRADLAPLFRIKAPAYYRNVVSATAGYNARDDAMRVACPVLVLLGSKDELFPARDAVSAHHYMPHAEIQIVPGGTHVMTFLNGEEIARRIEAFGAARDAGVSTATRD